MAFPELKTDRLILRSFTSDDIPAIYEIFSDRDVNRFLPWFPLASLPEAEIFYKEHYIDETGYKYAVCLKEDDYPIGYVNVSSPPSFDLGYGLRKEFWHRGIVTEAGKAVIEQIRKDGLLPYITATHDVNNPASGQVMRAVGMKYMYSYEELWQPKNYSVIFRMYQLNLDGDDSRVYRKYWERYPRHFVETGV